MHQVTYSTTDSKGVTYSGEFQTIHKEPREITRKVLQRHPEISLPFTVNEAEVHKVIKKK